MKKLLTARRLRLGHTTVRDLSAVRGAAPSPMASVYVSCPVNQPPQPPQPNPSWASLVSVASCIAMQGCMM
jgi:hypothetical protein